MSAIQTPAAAEAKPDPKVPQYVTRKIGPLPCRFIADRALPDDKRPSHMAAVPDVMALAVLAEGVLSAKAHVYPGMEKSEYRKRLLAPKPTREAARWAVVGERLRSPKAPHDLYTKAELAPLVTLVRKQLVANLRAAFKARDKADREAARQEAVRARQDQRAKARAQAKAMAKACCAVLPENARPTKAISRDDTRPAMCGAQLLKEGTGAKARWVLCATDSYMAVLYPLTVFGGQAARMRECIIPADALKAIEKAGAFRFTKDGLIEPITYTTVQESVKNGRGGWVYAAVPVVVPAGSTLYKPSEANGGKPVRMTEGLRPAKHMVLPVEPPAKRRIELTFDAGRLDDLASALGKTGVVTIQIDVDKLVRLESGERVFAVSSKTQGVSPTIRAIARDGARGASAHLMPVRRNV